jgi:predicted PurR-regulated permease PerM
MAQWLPSRDLARTMLAILLLGGMMAGSFWILRPFLPAIIWSAMIVVATWPLMLAMQTRLWNRRRPAVAVMIVALLLVLVVPFSLAIGTIAANADQIGTWAKSLGDMTLPAAPQWLTQLPLLGPSLAKGWQKFASFGPGELSARLSPYARQVGGWLLARAGSFGMLFVHFALTLTLSAILFAKGETVAGAVNRFAWKIAGPRGEKAVLLAAQAIRAVALGIIVTALAQSALSGIGLAIAGVPYAAFLTALIFILAVAQLGVAPVLAPIAIWLYWKGSIGWGTFLLIWTVLIGLLENFMRPLLIRRGADIPLLLIFAGVVGGLVAFGIIGLFIGPVVLAVSYTLLAEWVREPESPAAAARNQAEAGEAPAP